MTLFYSTILLLSILPFPSKHNNMTQIDQKFMTQALKLARLGGRAVAPNPMVGAVIVKGGKVIGKGYHQKFGGPHAEVNAIYSVKNKADLHGSTIYVTLEPCRHQGKTPPCWNLIQSVGIVRVVCGSVDPWHGKDSEERGAKSVEQKKLTAHRSPLFAFSKGKIAKECRELNKFFFTSVEKKRPYITVKIAMSADGFVAGENGQAVHFTTKSQDQRVHELRAQHQAIMVGSNTVLLDNPHLGVRHVPGQDPLRIILDSKKRVAKTAQVFRDKNFLHVQKKIPLKTLFKQLAKKGIASVLVEPGPTLYQIFKRDGLIDELIVLKGKKKLGKGLKVDL